MVRIQKVLDDAERRRLEDSVINNWINELRDVMYDAEDIIDLCFIKGSQLLDEHPSPSLISCCNSSFFSCFLSAPRRYEIGERINNLNGRLEEIYKDRSQFNIDHHNSKTNPTMVNSHQISPIVAELEVVGREIEDATKELIKLMTRGDVRKLSVFAITGMGGIGKTTLAQKISKHHKIQAEFKIKEWICVLQNYNEIDLLKQVIRGAKGKYGDSNTKAELEPLVRSAISGESIFLVLDDVWRADVWTDLLRNPLHSAKITALILITSRDENVAKQMGSVYIHPVVQLPVETGWEMLKRRLVMIGGREELIYNLRDIGIQIIEKCHGLPLAIKAMAGVLARKEPVVHQWKKVLNNNAWWMSKLPEELNPLDYEGRTCKMHDLIRALAQFISREEGFSGNVTEKSIIPLTKPRRLAVTMKGNATGVLGAIPEPKCLRSLFIFSGFQTADFNQLVRFMHLPVLDLTENEIECIPSAIGELVHLRHLDLGRTLIRELPESIGCLTNLQCLSLCGCKNLTYLPQSITQLQNLRRLALSDTPLRFIPKGIERLKQLNGLKGFVVGDDSISNQVGGKQVIMHSTLKELRSLSKLSILSICNLERAQSGSLDLRELSQLKELLLSCSPVHSNEHRNEEPFLIEKLFEELVPPKSLEQLYIKGFFGLSYPKWMLSLSLGSYLPYLSILDLADNMSCSLLPPLGQLPQLRILHIGGANAVKCIGLEFLGGGVAAARSEHKIAFPVLQVLTIDRMKNLDEWFFSYEQEEKNDGLQKLVLFPRLHELSIIDCPKLRSLPTGLGRTGLKELYVRGANRLKEVGNLTQIAEWVQMYLNQSLERISNLPAMKRLSLGGCYALKYVESLDGLQQLDLVDDSMDCLPEWLLRLIEERLRGREAQEDEDDFLLQLWCNERVLRRCLRGGEDWALIQQIPRLNAYVEEGEGYLRFVKQPFSYETNIGAL